ncbi:MAG TPA: tetratricopeptide repeat protein [Caulobacteraceae bacterium]
MKTSWTIGPALLALALASPQVGTAGALHLFGKAKPAAAVAVSSAQADAVASDVRQALDEKRLVDAANLLEQAEVNRINSPHLQALDGELLLDRGHFADALSMFKKAGTEPSEQAEALQGQGLALSMMGRSEEAFADLKQATALDKTLWRAWNGLGREYDLRSDWKLSLAAYDQALVQTGANTAIVLNNRGYSHLLQRQMEPAKADFVAAIEKDPGMAAARTNLRIAMAIDGQYDRAASAGIGDDRAAVLNNVGLAAAIRGDYPEAEKLLNEAIQIKGSYYERASDNLQLAKQLETHQADHPTPLNDNH